MKIKYITTENIEPEMIAEIEPKNSLIICSDLKQKNIRITPSGELSYTTTRQINLSNCKKTSNKELVLDFSPQFQISYPLGTHLIFDAPEGLNYLSKYYFDYDTIYSKDNVICTKIKTLLHIDVSRLNDITGLSYISEGMSLFRMRLIPQINLLTGNFSTIDRIYFIRDQETNKQFLDLFTT
jgi:hypothetical protein